MEHPSPPRTPGTTAKSSPLPVADTASCDTGKITSTLTLAPPGDDLSTYDTHTIHTYRVRPDCLDWT